MVGDRQGKCVNIGNCSLADKREPVAAKAGQDFVCPECGKSLIAAMPAAAGSAPKRNVAVIVAIALLLILLGGALLLRGRSHTESTPPAEPARPAVSVPGPAAPAPAATAAPATEGGDCSNTHGQVGLCAKAR